MEEDLFESVPQITEGIIRWLEREEHPSRDALANSGLESIWRAGIPEAIYEEMGAGTWIRGAFNGGMWAWLLFSSAFEDVAAHYKTP